MMPLQPARRAGLAGHRRSRSAEASAPRRNASCSVSTRGPQGSVAPGGLGLGPAQLADLGAGRGQQGAGLLVGGGELGPALVVPGHLLRAPDCAPAGPARPQAQGLAAGATSRCRAPRPRSPGGCWPRPDLAAQPGQPVGPGSPRPCASAMRRSRRASWASAGHSLTAFGEAVPAHPPAGPAGCPLPRAARRPGGPAHQDRGQLGHRLEPTDPCRSAARPAVARSRSAAKENCDQVSSAWAGADRTADGGVQLGLALPGLPGACSRAPCRGPAARPRRPRRPPARSPASGSRRPAAPARNGAGRPGSRPRSRPCSASRPSGLSRRPARGEVDQAGSGSPAWLPACAAPFPPAAVLERARRFLDQRAPGLRPSVRRRARAAPEPR